VSVAAHVNRAVAFMPDGSRAVVPVWMLDRVVRATLNVGPPRCSVAVLCDLRSLLDALGFMVVLLRAYATDKRTTMTTTTTDARNPRQQ
jgi:hypothetical protein